MRRFPGCVIVAVVGWAASSALGQGLYGAPDLLPLIPEPAPLRLADDGPSPPARTYFGSPAHGHPSRLAPASAAAAVPANAAPYHEPLAPMPPPVPRQQPVDRGASFYDRSDDEPNGGVGGTGNRFFDAVCGYDCDPTHQPKWYASALGLFLARDRANGVATTLDPASGNLLMRTTDANVDWRGGYEVKIGARFGDDANWAIESGYWTIDRFRRSAETSLPPGMVATPLIVDGIEFAGVNGDDFFDNAGAHRLLRVNRMESAELSLVHRSGDFDLYRFARLDFSLMAGVRYVAFQEDLTFGALINGGTWGAAGGIDEAYLNDRVINTLIGFQFGVDSGCRLGRTIRLFATPKVGIYNNHVQSRFDAFRGDRTRGNPAPATGITRTYPVSADQDVFSFLGQIDVGLDWQLAPRWTAEIGYRLVAATGMGLADHQFPNDAVDFAFLDTVRSNGNLLVHGALAGLKVEF